MGNLLRFVRARAHVHALMTQKNVCSRDAQCNSRELPLGDSL